MSLRPSVPPYPKKAHFSTGQSLIIRFLAVSSLSASPPRVTLLQTDDKDYCNRRRPDILVRRKILCKRVPCRNLMRPRSLIGAFSLQNPLRVERYRAEGTRPPLQVVLLPLFTVGQDRHLHSMPPFPGSDSPTRPYPSCPDSSFLLRRPLFSHGICAFFFFPFFLRSGFSPLYDYPS